MVNRLSLVPGESASHGLHFWEPMVDGRTLRAVFTDAPGDESADWVVGDNVAVFVHSWPVGIPNEVYVLLGEQPPELANGRIPVFVCAECGDLGCGALTAEVEWTPTTVIWRNFGWDVNYETDDEEDLVFAGPLVFDRDQYETELRRFIQTFDQVRDSLPAHLHPATRSAEARVSREQGRVRRRRRWPFR